MAGNGEKKKEHGPCTTKAPGRMDHAH